MDSVPGLLFACAGIKVGVVVVVCGPGGCSKSSKLVDPVFAFSTALIFMSWLSSEATLPEDGGGCTPSTILTLAAFANKG